MTTSCFGVIGLGLIGTAVASTLARAGQTVVGWNRTAAPRPELVAAGVTIAPGAGDLIDRCDVLIVVTLNYKVAAPLFERRASLAGKTVIQLTTGSPDEARAWAAQVQARGAAYLDGAIKKGPHDFGTERGAMVYAGSRETFDLVKEPLQAFGGRQAYLSADPGAAKGFELATFARSYPWMYGYFEALALAQRYGIGVADFTDLMLSVIGSTIRNIERAVAQIEKGEYELAQHASINVHHAALAECIAGARAAGLNTPLLDIIKSYMEKSIAAGLGDRDIAACYSAVAADVAAAHLLSSRS